MIASLCVGSIALVGLGALVKRLPFNASLVAALGGLTYPLYLLHQHVGYIIFNWSEGLLPDWLLVTAVIAMMLVLSWTIWRFVEPKGQRLTRHLLSSAAVCVSGWRQSTSMLGSSPARRAGRHAGARPWVTLKGSHWRRIIRSSEAWGPIMGPGRASNTQSCGPVHNSSCLFRQLLAADKIRTENQRGENPWTFKHY